MSGLFFNDFPYTDFHELNLSWIIKKIIELNETVKNFVSLNTVKYADPIQWNITTQYEKNTVVVDPQTGTAYLSVQPVPSGVAISNTDYWTVIFTLDFDASNDNITLRNDGNNTLSTFASDVGDWLLWNSVLYKVIQPINVSQAYLPGFNIERYTVELFVKDYVDMLTTEITTLSDNVGDLQNLTTVDKTSIVNAINEIVSSVPSVTDRPYINIKDFGAVGDGVTDDYQAFVNAYSQATEGSSIIVPHGVYNLSANPDTHTKNIRWIFDYGTSFVGDGAKGGLDGVVNGFISPASNPYNIIARNNSKMYNTIDSPIGGGVCVDSYEVDSSDRGNKMITGTITNGSAIMTGVSDLNDIAVGDSILASGVTGWLDGSTRANSVRVVSIDHDNNTITFGSTPAPSAIPGDGWCVATPWTGASQTANFIIRPRVWTVNKYLGIETSNIDNIDEFGYLINGVFNVNGGVGNAVELDINLMGPATGGTVGLLLTGIGDYADPNYGIRIDRGGLQNWTTGIDINNCLFGVGISAYQPMLIKSGFYDNVTQSTISPLYGILIDNVSDLVPTTRPLFGGEQLVNNAVGILLARADDVAPSGSFITCMNHAHDTEIFKVDVTGEVTTPSIKVAQNFTAETVTCNYTFTVKDINGSVLKVPCYFGP